MLAVVTANPNKYCTLSLESHIMNGWKGIVTCKHVSHARVWLVGPEDVQGLNWEVSGGYCWVGLPMKKIIRCALSKVLLSTVNVKIEMKKWEKKFIEKDLILTSKQWRAAVSIDN